jgi:hypothetical protein
MNGVRRGDRGDAGSVVMALLAILTMAGIVTLGLATVVGSHLAARHDVAFESSLAAAEQGLDELAAQVKATPLASSFNPVTGSTAQGAAYSATATATAGGWTVTASGTATIGGRSVTRRIQATVSVGNLVSVPLFGDSGVTLGSGSGVDRYDSSSSSAVCTTSTGSRAPMGTTGTRMCTEASPPLGSMATDGALDMKGSDLPNFAEVDIFSTPYPGYTNDDATGRCANDATTCAAIGSTVITHHEKATFPPATLCANGIGGGTTAYDGSTALAANAVYDFSDVTLNATAIANLGNVAGSQLIICFNGKLTLPAAFPLNATLDSSSLVLTDPASIAGVTNVVPRPPSTLLLVSTSGGASAPVVDFGGGSHSETAVSAVVYAPNATCTTQGHVDVYGLLVCGSVVAPSGLNVHYDTQLQNLSFDRPVTVSKWHEL